MFLILISMIISYNIKIYYVHYENIVHVAILAANIG